MHVCASSLHDLTKINQPIFLTQAIYLTLKPCFIQILGYARKVDNNWSFSPAAVSILEEFQSQFPGLLEYICANPGEDKYYEEDLFPDAEGWVLAILLACVWLSFLEPWSVQVHEYDTTSVFRCMYCTFIHVDRVSHS